MRNILFLLFLSLGLVSFSQELNCSVVVNAQQTGNENQTIFKGEFKKTLIYLSEHPEINEIIFSGGDPLTRGVDNSGQKV